jgi:exosortase
MSVILDQDAREGPRSAISAAAVAGPAGLRTRSWPGAVIPAAYVVVIAWLTLPTMTETVKLWLSDDNYAHGLLIWPLAVLLIWADRVKLARQIRRPSKIGLCILLCGLFILAFGQLFQVRYVGYWSLQLVLAGSVLTLYGAAMWRIVRFPILFLLFAGGIPQTLLSIVTLWIRGVSTAGSAMLMQAFGFAVLRHGNLLDVPGLTLEVADVCSGYKKLLALLAFGALYGHVYALKPAQRLLMLALAIPVALLTNVLRIAGLIAAATYFGRHGLQIAHEFADYIALLLALGLFVAVGRGIPGCRQLRYYQSQA